MKLLVTGGAGYIGSVVSRQLLAAGHEVVVLDNLERGHRAAVAAEARLVVVDLRDGDAVHKALAEGFDGVLHFAAFALVGESVSHPERYYRNNVVGSLNLLEAMRDAGVPRLVFSSTCAVYGQPDEVPISEQAPPRPANAYGASKLAVDGMIGDFCVAHGLGAVSLRYFNVAGASARRGRGPRSRDPPDSQHPAHRPGPQSVRRGVRHRLPDARWHGHPRLHPHRGPVGRPPAGARRDRRGRAQDLQPR